MFNSVGDCGSLLVFSGLFVDFVILLIFCFVGGCLLVFAGMVCFVWFWCLY